MKDECRETRFSARQLIPSLREQVSCRFSVSRNESPCSAERKRHQISLMCGIIALVKGKGQRIRSY
jgi:hypothetical protein